MKAHKFVVTIDVTPDYGASDDFWVRYRPGDIHHWVGDKEVSMYEFYYTYEFHYAMEAGL